MTKRKPRTKPAPVDPTTEPEDTIIDDAPSADETKGDGVDQGDESSGEIRQDDQLGEPLKTDAESTVDDAPQEPPKPEVEHSLDQLMRMVSESTPTTFQGSVSRRINDTGNVLTPRQSIAYERITRFAIENKEMFESRSGRDQVPCHKKAHVMRFLLDRMADILEVYDAQEVA